MQIVGQRGVLTQTLLFHVFARIELTASLTRSAFLNIHTNYWIWAVSSRYLRKNSQPAPSCNYGIVRAIRKPTLSLRSSGM
jgi:hypothetical protein